MGALLSTEANSEVLANTIEWDLLHNFRGLNFMDEAKSSKTLKISPLEKPTNGSLIIVGYLLRAICYEIINSSPGSF